MNRAVTMVVLPIVVATLTSYALGGGALRTSRNQSWKDKPSSSDIIPGIVVVKLRHSYSVPGGPVVHGQGPLLNAFSERGVTSVARAFPSVKPLSDADVAAGKIDLSQIHFATIPPDLDPRDIASRLAQLPQVEYAEPKYYSYLCDVPNDSDYSATQQVYFDRMNVAAGWAIQKGSPSVVIATVDGGTDWLHPDLLPNIWINPGEDLNHDGIFERFPPQGGDLNSSDDDNNGFIDDVVGWNFTNETNDPRGFLSANANHGTETASAFGAVTNNGQGMAGTSWNCRIMAVCAADPLNENTISHGFEGIQYAAANGACVINCSWGRPGNTGLYSQYEQDVITAATDSGALIVAAVDDHHGKTDFDNIPFYPAAYKHVLSVGATEDTSDALAHFSQYGVNVSVYAPGMRIHVALANGSYGTDQGTSFSCPLVAGLAGLLVATHPDWKPDQIAEQIRMTADPIDASNPGYAGLLGHGRVNFGRALSEVHSGVTIVDWHFNTPSGRAYYINGETVTLSLMLKNVLSVSAQNLSFDVSADSALLPFGVAQLPTHLGPGAVDSVDFTFRAGDPGQPRNVSIKLGWVANANERDAHVFTTTLYPLLPWQFQKSPVSTSLNSIHAVNSKVVWATGSEGVNSHGVVLRTTDGGGNWTIATGNLQNVGCNYIFAVDSLHAWVGTAYSGQIYASTDGGLTWSLQVYPAPQTGWIDGIWFFDAKNGYALGDPPQNSGSGRFVVLQTTDGGATWSHIAHEPVGEVGTGAKLNTFCWTDKYHGWFGAYPGSLVWRTTDGGETWSHASMGTSTGETTSLAMRDDSVGIAGQRDEVLARTTDGGGTWSPVPSGGADWFAAAAFPVGSASAWTSGGYTVDHSSDNGVSWALQPTFPVLGYLLAMSFCDSANGWIATPNGEILRYHDLGPTNGLPVVSNPEVPGRYLLEQSYPNPFNPTTTIEYSIPIGTYGRTSLRVYDILGREVAVLVNERKAPGNYAVQFNASGFASGMYLYRLTVGSFVQSRKMLVVK